MWAYEHVTTHIKPTTVLDVGPGVGTYSDLMREPWQHWDAIEIFEPYVEKYGLKAKYDHIDIGDVRNVVWGYSKYDVEYPHYDLIIFGDVLEHMDFVDAAEVWRQARDHAKYLLLSLPIFPYPQGELEGNKHEAHLHHWSDAEVQKHLPGIYCQKLGTGVPGEMVGVYFARGNVR